MAPFGPSTQRAPHPFKPLRWTDRLHSWGRCYYCTAPKHAHNLMPKWHEARAIGDTLHYKPSLPKGK